MSEEKFDFAAIQREMLEEAMGIRRIQTIDGATLMDKQIEHRDFTVADILPAGLTLLVGAPKVGKSFFVLGLCLAVLSLLGTTDLFPLLISFFVPFFVYRRHTSPQNWK